mmetsp:Transcript_39416/g.42703  ORF Transcript_39416/g.42703 Transcript_39416/m.42703 type:complete len:91 (-) Transcript_39416:572-844(-)
MHSMHYRMHIMLYMLCMLDLVSFHSLAYRWLSPPLFGNVLLSSSETIQKGNIDGEEGTYHPIQRKCNNELSIIFERKREKESSRVLSTFM